LLIVPQLLLVPAQREFGRAGSRQPNVFETSTDGKRTRRGGNHRATLPDVLGGADPLNGAVGHGVALLSTLMHLREDPGNLQRRTFCVISAVH
jgi:hypothetical protein